MANHDKGRRKWPGISQDNADRKFEKDRLMGGRRGGHRGAQAIYTPGSGPLKKSDRQDDDYNNEGTISKRSVQDRLKPTHFNNTNSPEKISHRDETNSTLTNKLNEMHINYRPRNNDQAQGSVMDNHIDGDPRRRNKKPEQQLYVPKKVYEPADSDVSNRSSVQSGWDRGKDRDDSRDWETQSNRSYRSDNSRRDNRPSRNAGRSSNQDTNNRLKDNHTKHYSSNRKNRNCNDNDESYHSESPASSRSHGNRREPDSRRNVRQGSEPPNTTVTTNNVNNESHRNRDTRSVEPSGFDKFPRKPPSGRRGHPKVNPLKIESLPPRFQKKYFAENGIVPPAPPPPPPPAMMNNIEDSWDTRPIIPSYQYNPSGNIPHLQTMQSLPPTGPLPPQQWMNTVPIRSRGRGRFRPEELEASILRPGTPDQYSAPSSRSHTPSQELINRIYDRRGSNSTMCTSMESLSRVDSLLMPPPPSISPAVSISSGSKQNHGPVLQSHTFYNQKLNNNSCDTKNITTNDKQNDSPYKNEAFGSLPDMPSDTLDWSEEVELSEKLENERLSRSSSVLSFRENASVSGNLSSTSGRSGRHRNSRKRKNRRRAGDRSNSRDNNSRERKNNEHNRENDNYNNNEKNNRRFDNRRGKIIHHSRESSKERGHRRTEDFCKTNSRSDFEENWRSGKRVSTCESEEGGRATTPSLASQAAANSNSNHIRSISPLRTGGSHPPGVLVLPEPTKSPPAPSRHETRPSPPQRKTLYDPNNPNKPIIVPSPGSRASIPNELSTQSGLSGFRGPSQFQQSLYLDGAPAPYIAEQINNVRPAWYDLSSESLRNAKNPCLLMGIETIDRELQWLLSSGGLTANWDRVDFLRRSLQQSLQNLLETDMKFCQAENVEQHFWKILYYNIIEMLRRVMPKETPENRDLCKKIMLKIIDDGTVYFENLLAILETTYKFKLDTFLSTSAAPKGLGFVGLALISAQKIFLFLGDLARYKEQANETTNYGKSRQWYLKAQQINPKNGRPYNQLALLAHYARRKLDAVYYYMRSLMASNPFHSARESLIALFDENRKKYESTERKRKEEREWKERARMKEKEGANNIAGGLRRETWIHPGGRRMRRTTSTASASEAKLVSSDLEELAQLSSVEVNKRFVTSYLHVHGKLITKIGFSLEITCDAVIQIKRPVELHFYYVCDLIGRRVASINCSTDNLYNSSCDEF